MKARTLTFVCLHLLVQALWIPTATADLPQHQGWPVKMAPGISGGYLLSPMHGLALADLDGKPPLEVIASSGDRVWVWDPDGKEIAGWPQTVTGTAQAPPTVGDLDGDGDLEVVQVARGLQYSDSTVVQAWHHDGKPVDGWPINFPNLVFHPVTLADLDGNGALDVIVQIGRWPPAGSIQVFAGDTSPLGSTWSHELGGLPGAPVAVGDLDDDGGLEVVTLTDGELTVRRSDGALMPPFPLKAETGRKYDGGVALADLDPQSKGLEIITGEVADSASPGEARLLVFTGTDGKPLAGFPSTLASSASGLTPPTVGDLNGDGQLEIVIAVRGEGLAVVGTDGKLQGQLIKTQADTSASIQLLDLDGDGSLELLADNNSTDMSTGQGYLEAYHADGSPVAGFPLRPTGSTLANGASAADLDGDGKLELAIPTTLNASPPAEPESWANLWDLAQSKGAKGDWPTYGYDVRRSNCAGGCTAKSSKQWHADGGQADTGTGADGPVVAADAGPDAPMGGDGSEGDDGSGCGCRLAGTGKAQSGSALLLAMVVICISCRRWCARKRSRTARL